VTCGESQRPRKRSGAAHSQITAMSGRSASSMSSLRSSAMLQFQATIRMAGR